MNKEKQTTIESFNVAIASASGNTALTRRGLQLFTFCDAYIQASKSSSTDEFFEEFKKTSPEAAAIVAEICDTEVREMDAFDIQNMPLLRVYLVLHAMDTLLSKVNVRCIFNTLVNLSAYDLDRPVDPDLLCLLYNAVYVQWCLMNSLNDRPDGAIITAAKFKYWVANRFTNPTVASITSVVFSLMGDIVTYRKNTEEST